MKNVLLVLLLLLTARVIHAQTPDWEMVASDYQYSMTITAFLNIDGITLSSENDRVGAFVGTERRGNANLIFVEGVDRHLAFLTIYANEVGEEISFKIYNSGDGSVVPVDRTVEFQMDAHYGSVLMAYSLAAPTLNSEAVFYEFGFDGVSPISTIISTDQVEIALNQGQSLTSLIRTFTVSDGATVYVGDSLVVSDTDQVDLTFPVTYTVVSQDESNYTVYQVRVQNQEVPAFVTTNVITVNGDGSNDFWVVTDAHLYSDYTFRIFDANGRVLLQSIGYGNDWDGYHNGKRLDRGKYYYVVESKERDSIMTGEILVLY